ncbi:unnamed protein product [Rhizopus stolonifer]
MTGSAVSWGLYFGWYSLLKKYMTKDKEGKLSPLQHLTASAEAGINQETITHKKKKKKLTLYMAGKKKKKKGVLIALIANPLWVTKTRMCTTTRYTPGAYKGLADGLGRLYGEEGIRGLYRGLVPALFGVSHGAIQFMVYEEMKKRRNEMRQRQGIISSDELNAKLDQTEYLVMAVTSKVIAAVSTYPYQVVKSRLQNQATIDTYTGVIDCVKKIMKAEGCGGFYKGLAPNVIRVLPGTCITFLVYENLTQWFKDHAS